MAQQDFVPKIVGFLCNWCTYTAADGAGVGRFKMPPTMRIIRVMCSSRVNPLFILNAFLRGADGVFIGGCHPGECHYGTGNYHARRRVAMLNSIFETLGLEMADRLRLSWVSASEARRFAEVVDEFNGQIEEQGPSMIRNEMFL